MILFIVANFHEGKVCHYLKILKQSLRLQLLKSLVKLVRAKQ